MSDYELRRRIALLALAGGDGFTISPPGSKGSGLTVGRYPPKREA